MAIWIDYSFGRSSFQNFVWLQDGTPFRNPRELSVEMSNPGAFALEIQTEAGTLV